MFFCPNCYEEIDNHEAQVCPHCGSDAETGWKSDADYHSIELPEDEPFDLETPVYREDHTLRLTGLIGPALVAFTLVLFVIVGYQGYRLGIVIPTLFLTVAAFVCLRLLARKKEGRR